MQLEPYNYTVIHTPGTENEAAEALSRYPSEWQTVDEEMLEDYLIEPLTGREILRNTQRITGGI